MKLSALFFSAAYLATVVFADEPPISITSPLAGTHMKAGTEVIISWVAPKVKTISQIVLAKGSSTSLQPLMTIATNVNADDLKYVWKVPMELADGDDYAFKMGTSPNLAFTGAFSIEGGSGGPLPAQNNTSGQAPPVRPSNGPSSPSSTLASGTQPTKPSESPNASHTSSAPAKSQNSLITLGVLALASVAAQYLF